MKKNAFFVLGTAALALVFGLALAGCPTGMTGITVAVTGASTDTYTVIFAANAGGGAVTGLPAPITGVASGETVAQPVADPARTGYDFGGWYKEAAATTQWNFATDTVTRNVTLYAKWTAAELVVAEQYRFADLTWRDEEGHTGAMTLAANSLTITGYNAVTYSSVYTQGGGTNEYASPSGMWAYLYDGSGKIGVVADYGIYGITVFLGQTKCSGMDFGEGQSVDTSGMQNSQNRDSYYYDPEIGSAYQGDYTTDLTYAGSAGDTTTVTSIEVTDSQFTIRGSGGSFPDYGMIFIPDGSNGYYTDVGGSISGGGTWAYIYLSSTGEKVGVVSSVSDSDGKVALGQAAIDAVYTGFTPDTSDITELHPSLSGER